MDAFLVSLGLDPEEELIFKIWVWVKMNIFYMYQGKPFWSFSRCF